MKGYWQPIIPIRWKTNQDGTPPTLQQAWALFERSSDGRYYQSNVYVWKDVPFDIDDRNYWSEDVK